MAKNSNFVILIEMEPFDYALYDELGYNNRQSCFYSEMS